MRLVTYEVATPFGPVRRSGALTGQDAVIDLSLARAAALGGRPRAVAIAAAEVPADLLEFRAAASGRWRPRATPSPTSSRPASRRSTARACDMPWPTSAAPLPRPNSLRDYLVVEEHLRNCVDQGIVKGIPPEWYEAARALQGQRGRDLWPGRGTLPWPPYTDKLDYELEICAVLGASGRKVRAEDATPMIAGYTIYNDWSARDIQGREMAVGIGPGIAKDFASSIGPCIATPDEFDRDHAKLEARIDGEVWSTGELGKMHFTFEQIIEYTSQEATLQPGDLLGSGTVGRGCGRRWTAGCRKAARSSSRPRASASCATGWDTRGRAPSLPAAPGPSQATRRSSSAPAGVVRRWA